MRSRTRQLIAAVLLCGSAGVHAQLQRPRVEVTPVVVTTPATRGATIVAALKVRLPKDLHVQADKPRDPSLIPTSLAVNAPPGVTVEKIVYPTASEFSQAGRGDKLLVFGPEFDIQVHLAIGDAVPAGEVAVPARLRYQACNDTMCFPPARVDARWTLHVVPKP